MCFQTWFKNRRANDHKTGRSIPYRSIELTNQQRIILEGFYSHYRYPTDEEVQALMRQTNLTYQKLKVRVYNTNKF